MPEIRPRVTAARVTKGSGMEPRSAQLAEATWPKRAGRPSLRDDVGPSSDGGEVTDVVQHAARGGRQG